MSATAFTAGRVAERLRRSAEPPWEVYGERLRRFEVHLNGSEVEMRRGPVTLEGYGIRLFQPSDGKLAVGAAASTDLSDAGVASALRSASEAQPHALFPAHRIELPSTQAKPASAVTVDETLWRRPVETIDDYLAALIAPFDGRAGEAPSFGSVRVTLGEVTIANSEGLQRHHPFTTAEMEIAVKSSGGAEGAPPGEYWVNRTSRRLASEGLAEEVDRWCRIARDVRHASSPTSGPTNVVLPPAVLADILPPIVGYRMSGAAALRKMTPDAGSTVGSEVVTFHDDGLYPYGLGTAPTDDEGIPQAKRTLIERGRASPPLLDLLHGSALGHESTGNGRRAAMLFPNWFHFTQSPVPNPTTLALAPDSGGTEAELIEAAGDGIYVDQLGYAFPDPLSSSYGGELRAAYRIRNGKLAEPLRGGTVGGVVFAGPDQPSLLSQISAVGTRPVLAGNLSAPAVLVQGMTVAGS